MRNVLFISLKFPPLSDIGAKRPLRFVRRLPALGWRPILLTLPEGFAGTQDRRLLDFVPADAVIHRSYAGGPLAAFIQRAQSAWSKEVGRVVADGSGDGPRANAKGAGGRDDPPTTNLAKPSMDLAKLSTNDSSGGEAEEPGGWTAWRRKLIYQLEDLAEGLAVTDEWLPFVPWGAFQALRLIRRYNCEAIYVCGDPNSSYIAAYLAHLATGLPLVLDMRDPWTLDPTIKALKRPFTQRVEERLERRIFAAAKTVILNTDRAREAYLEFYPDMSPTKFEVIHNAFDPELVVDPEETQPIPPDEGFTLAHFGNYHRLRSARVFLQGFRRFLDERKPSKARIVNFGEFRLDDRKYAESLGLGDVLEVRPYVPYPEFPRHLRRARGLLLEQRNAEDVQIPAKFYDYCLAGRPILNLSRNQELAGIIARSGLGVSVAPDDPADVARGLGELSDLSLDTWRARLDRTALRRYSADNNSEALSRVLSRAAPVVLPK